MLVWFLNCQYLHLIFPSNLFSTCLQFPNGFLSRQKDSQILILTRLCLFWSSISYFSASCLATKVFGIICRLLSSCYPLFSSRSSSFNAFIPLSLFVNLIFGLLFFLSFCLHTVVRICLWKLCASSPYFLSSTGPYIFFLRFCCASGFCF